MSNTRCNVFQLSLTDMNVLFFGFFSLVSFSVCVVSFCFDTVGTAVPKKVKSVYSSVKSVYSSLCEPISELWGITSHEGSQWVTSLFG